jgi:hypothetical protein
VDDRPGTTDDGVRAELAGLEESAADLAGRCRHPHTAHLLARVVDVLADARTVLALELSLERLRSRPR